MISKIYIENFRNIKKKVFQFSSETTVIVGDNASGKTNILEAIYLLSTGKSFRAKIEEEMVNHRAEIARVKGVFETDLKLDTVLTRGEITVGENPEKMQSAPRKRLFVNGVAKRLFNFAGNFSVVLFAPQDLEIVTESPSIRRRFLDSVLSQVDREYRRASLSYEKGLRQRNKLLLRIREENLSRSQLLFWNTLLIKNGNYITEKRRELIDFINKTKDYNGQDFSIDYDDSTISESRIEQYAQEEIAAATTLVGPHRDDFLIRLKKNKRPRELSRFGSRGEQRMGVLWLKLAELAFIESKTGEKPTLLLDDIFSELDHEHRDIVMKVVRGHQTPLRQGSAGQAIITTADPHYVERLKFGIKIVL